MLFSFKETFYMNISTINFHLFVLLLFPPTAAFCYFADSDVLFNMKQDHKMLLVSSGTVTMKASAESVQLMDSVTEELCGN